MRALDLGAGTGAAGDAVRACFGGHVEIVAVDKVGGPGIVVADLAREERPPGVKGRFDLIVAAHLLNELAASLAARAEMVVGWCRDFLEEGGLCVLLEPALRETSRDLLAVRDLVLERGLRVVAPCFWTGACPALVRERDWCHDSVASPGQPRVDFSYLVLERAAAPPPEDRSLFRVVSDPLKDKGRLRLFGCGAAGRLPLVRLKRDRSDANGAFDAAVRGDVITVTGAVPTNDGLRITSDTTTCLPRSRRGT